MRIIKKLSPNYSPSVYPKRGVQIHKTLGTDSLGWLLSPKSQASAHFLIKRDSTIYQLVELKDRAWAAGRIVKPNERGKAFMAKDKDGKWIKPGYYTVEIEFECLLSQTFTEAQYEAALWLFKQFDFNIDENNLLTHTDTCWYKPDLTKERRELLKRLGIEIDEERIKLLQQSIIVLTNKVIELYRKILLLRTG